MGRFSGDKEAFGRGWRLMAKKKKSLLKGRKQAPGPGKRYFLATMDDKLIKKLKQAAIAEDKSASQCLEIATQEWLERRESKAKKSSGSI
jgi:hypothetical protein